MIPLLLAGLAVPTVARAKANPPDYAPADSALTKSDGMTTSVATDQAPGEQRRADIARHNAILTNSGSVRLSRLLGEKVFTVSGMRVGSVREIVLNPTGAPGVVVKDRRNGRLVKLPWSAFLFGLRGNGLGERVVLPGVTENALSRLPEFHL